MFVFSNLHFCSSIFRRAKLLLIGTWIKEWEEEIVAMNHHFDESNDLIFTVFIIVIKTFPQRNPFILIFAIEAIVVEYHLFFIIWIILFPFFCT